MNLGISSEVSWIINTFKDAFILLHMAYFEQNRFGFKQASSPVNIPENDVARLMYYFDCVCSVIQYTDNDLNRFRNYRNWASLTYGERRTLLVLCLTFSPDEFDNRVFFHSDNLCGNSTNRFYELSQISNQVIAAREIIIAGQTHRVAKIMAYKMSWMQNYYYGPILRLPSQYNINAASIPCVIS